MQTLLAAAAGIDLTKVYAPDVAPEAWLAILPVALPLATGALLTAIRRRIDWHAPVALATLALMVLAEIALLAHVAVNGPVTLALGHWLPPFGIAFTVDVGGAGLALVAGVVTLAAAVFALDEIDLNHRRYGFYPFLLFLIAGVSGAFLTGDVFNLYVWFEVLLISSFGLLVLGGEKEQIDGALKYGLLNLVGTTLFLIATGYLYSLFGTLNMADIAVKVSEDKGDLPLGTLAALYLTAFGMKAAAFPLNAWLPASYHTPRMAAAALFAGLLTKVGVYALLRVLGMLMPAEGVALSPVIGAVAGLTMLAGAIGAIASDDLKRALGHWVVAGIGVALAGLAIGGEAGLSGAYFYLLHSMLAMSGLYFAVGVMTTRAGTSSLTKLGGLYKAGPGLTVTTGLLLLGLAGLPPLSGFWPKAMLVKAALAADHDGLAAAILVSGFLLSFAAGRVILLAFWRPGEIAEDRAPDHRMMTTAAAAMAALSLAIGLWPAPAAAVADLAARGFIDPAAYIGSALMGDRP
jgi:multicomponent Na+:H+ antiporter subunit D